MTKLADMRCHPQIGATLSDSEIVNWLAKIDGWERSAGGASIERVFKFADYYKTMAFVNTVAWIAHREDHHPDMDISYNRCRVRFSTHSVGGLSLNDFICAAKINALLMPTE